MARETDAPPQNRKRPRNGDKQSSALQSLLAKILSRLPVKSLIRFTCVSKEWKTLIFNPHFAKRQLQFSTATTVDPTTNHRLLWCKYDGPSEFISKSCSLYSIFNKPTTRATVSEKPKQFAIFIGSCNGLVCSLKRDNSFIIWNPTSRESKIIPAFNTNLSSKKWTPVAYGFGYDHINDDYKVVQMLRSSIVDCLGNIVWNQTVVKVYELRANCWKNIGNFPYKGFNDELGMFVNGTLNWFADREDGSLDKVVVSIDLVNYKLQPDYEEELQRDYEPECEGVLLPDYELEYEEVLQPENEEALQPENVEALQPDQPDYEPNYEEVLQPNYEPNYEEVLQPDYEDVDTSHIKLLGVLGGCLCIVHHYYNGNRWDVWVMKEFRVKESWTKLFSIPSSKHPLFDLYSHLMPLWVLENGEILFMYGTQLVIYNSKGNTFRDCAVHGQVFREYCTRVVYAESLVPPNVETEKLQHSEAASSHQ